MRDHTAQLLNGACTLVLTMAVALPVIADIPSAEEIADNLGLSSADKKSVLAGELVSRTMKSTNDRELAVTLAFIVTLSVDEVKKQARQHLLTKTDPETIAWAPITGEGNLDSFSTLNLDPDPDKRAQAYLNAKPGQALNLSKSEIATFNSMDIADGESAAAAVTTEVRHQLLNRFQSYRQKGLAGVSPYARARGKATAAADDLKSATESFSQLKKALPGLYKVLSNYPADKPEGLDESFMWSNYTAHGEPVFILTHDLSFDDSDAYVIVQRQFYVSGSYNAGQSITAFVPVKDGTVVFYVNRTSTDQVTGFGSSTKRSIGSKVMASQLKDLYQKVRETAEAGKG